jgi:hypothetical protein
MIVVSGDCAKAAVEIKSARTRKRMVRYVFLKHSMAINFITF